MCVEERFGGLVGVLSCGGRLVKGGVEGKGSRGHDPFEVWVRGGGRFEMSFVSWGAICFFVAVSGEVESVVSVWKSGLEVWLVC